MGSDPLFGHPHISRLEFPLLDTPCSGVISELGLLGNQEGSNEKKPGTVALSCSCHTGVEGIGGQRCQLHSELETNLGYMSKKHKTTTKTMLPIGLPLRVYVHTLNCAPICGAVKRHLGSRLRKLEIPVTLEGTVGVSPDSKGTRSITTCSPP